MSETRIMRETTRVLVALDGGEPSIDALTQLARLLDAATLEVTGLLVEDEDLLRAARLPGFCEVSLSGEIFPKDHERLRQDIEAESRRLRQAFEGTMQLMRYRFRFEVMRGRWIESLQSAALESDLLLVCRCARGPGLRPRAAPYFAPLLQPGRSVLIVNEPWASGHSVVVFGSGVAAARAASRVAEPEKLDLVVVLRTGEPVPAELPHRSILVRVDDWTEETIAVVCRQWEARLLVVASGAVADMAGLLDRLPCSLLRLA